MVYDFDPCTTLVVHYGPRATERYEKQRYILWPAFAYRVIAPEARERELNVFQQAVLGLCLTEDKMPDTMGKLLHLDPDLIQLVLRELLDRGLIDAQKRITPQGEKTLAFERHEIEGAMSYEVSYVFQDPWSGELWPRVVKDLEPVEARCSATARYPQLVLGTRGKQRSRNAFVKTMDSKVYPSPPDAADILDASIRHRRAIRARQYSEPGETEEGLDMPIPDARQLERVAIISEEPQPLFLVTYLYLARDHLEPESWFVCDPFGLGASTFLRQRIVQHLAADKALANEIGELCGVTPRAQAETEAWEDLMKGEVQKQLAQAIRFDDVLTLLLNMERARWRDGEKEEAPERLDDVLIKAGKALERLFRCLWIEHPPRDSWRVLMTADGSYREAVLNEIAAGLGYRLPVPNRIARTKASGIRWAGEKGEGSLGQRIVIALISAHADPGHPLRRAAIEAPELLDWLAELIEYRDESAHDVLHRRSLDDVERQVSTTYRAVRLLAR